MANDSEIKTEFITCDECGEEYEEDVIEEIDGTQYCEDCINECFGYCSSCDERFLNDDLTFYNCVEESYCSSCARDRIYTCDNCGDEYDSDSTEAVTSECGDCYCCYDCYGDNYFQCDSCGGEYDRDEMSCNDDGVFCPDCGNENGYCNGNLNPQYTDSVKVFNTRGYTVGVELETISPYGFDGFDTIDGEWFTSYIDGKGDGSLDSNGIEYVTPPINNDNVPLFVNRMCNVLNRGEFKVNESCGYHLHLGGKKINIAKNRHKILIVTNLFADAIKAMTSASRWRNNYCSFSRLETNPRLISKSATSEPERFFSRHSDRYSFVNFDSYDKFGTIEIRCHQGTINPEKILNWIKIFIKVFDFAINSTYHEIFNMTGTQREFRQRVLKSIPLIKYYNERVNKFGYKYNQKRKQLKTRLKEGLKRVCKVYEQHNRKQYGDNIHTVVTHSVGFSPKDIAEPFIKLFSRKEVKQINKELEWDAKKVIVRSINYGY